MFRSVCLAAASALVLGLSSGPAAAQTTAARSVPSAFEFGRVAAISDVKVSPDGKHVAALTSPDGKTINISVWRTDALDQAPVVLGSARMKLLSFNFIKNNRLAVLANQPHSIGSDRGHVYKLWITDLTGSNWTPALPEERSRSSDENFVRALSSPQILDDLPFDPEHILVVDTGLGTEGDVYRVNVNTRRAERIERGSEKFDALQTDLKGVVRAKQRVDYDGGAAFVAQYIKHPDTGAWEEHFRTYVRDREGISIIGFTSDPNIAYVASTKGRDKAGLFEYDIRARKILEPAFEHRLFGATGVYQSEAPNDYGRPLGFTYQGEAERVYWTDPKLASIAKGLNEALGVKTTPVQWTDPATNQTARFTMGQGVSADIVSWSRDLSRVIVSKNGPQQPPEYYLLTDGSKLQLLGRSRPQIDPALLGESRLIQYKARDGLMVPAFLHTPTKSLHGDGPYPTVILPHGGPWARDNYEYDVAGWVPYLVAQGYAVLQPQYRGSDGWGQKLWRAGDQQWGLAMQDDKDDGAKWLIEQKIAAPDRIAMFGYSYGGYAAMAASVRSNDLYQCAIAGAGFADLVFFKKETFNNRLQREFQNPTVRGQDFSGRAAEVKIPILIYHGDRDTNVELKEARTYANALNRAGKPHKLVVLEDMGHSYDTMTADHMVEQLQIIDRFLKNDCGPGGL